MESNRLPDEGVNERSGSIVRLGVQSRKARLGNRIKSALDTPLTLATNFQASHRRGSTLTRGGNFGMLKSPSGEGVHCRITYGGTNGQAGIF